MDVFRQNGIQITAQRLAVLDAVSAHSHISADGVVDVVSQAIGTVSRQTVYDSSACWSKRDSSDEYNRWDLPPVTNTVSTTIIITSSVGPVARLLMWTVLSARRLVWRPAIRWDLKSTKRRWPFGAVAQSVNSRIELRPVSILLSIDEA